MYVSLTVLGYELIISRNKNNYFIVVYLLGKGNSS